MRGGLLDSSHSSDFKITSEGFETASEMASRQAAAEAKIAQQARNLAEVRRRQDWRTLSPKSRTTLKAILQGAGSFSYSIRRALNDADAEELSKQLKDVFQQAGWTVAQFAPLGIVFGGPSTRAGVEIDADSVIHTIIAPLIMTLTQTHVAVQRTVYKMPSAGMVALLLVIGVKPPNPDAAAYVHVP